MELDKITLWAGTHGPCLTIVSFQWIIIWKLIKRFFDQQDMVMESTTLSRLKIRSGIDAALASISEGRGQ